jgi:hypothetical protein
MDAKQIPGEVSFGIDGRSEVVFLTFVGLLLPQNKYGKGRQGDHGHCRFRKVIISMETASFCQSIETIIFK